MKKVMEYLNVFRKYFRARQDVSDEILTIIYFIKEKLQDYIETDISRLKKKEKYFG